MSKHHFEDIEAHDLNRIVGGADEFGGGEMTGDFMADFGGGGELGLGGPALAQPTGETVPVSDGRSDYAPAPIYEGSNGRFVMQSDFPQGTQFFSNPSAPSGVTEWTREGGGFDRATSLMRTFNSLFGGRGANSPMAKTGYRPF